MEQDIFFTTAHHMWQYRFKHVSDVTHAVVIEPCVIKLAILVAEYLQERQRFGQFIDERGSRETNRTLGCRSYLFQGFSPIGFFLTSTLLHEMHFVNAKTVESFIC